MTLLHHVSKMFVELRSSSSDVQGLHGWAIFYYLLSRNGNAFEVSTNASLLEAVGGPQAEIGCLWQQDRVPLLKKQQKRRRLVQVLSVLMRLLRFRLTGYRQPQHKKQTTKPNKTSPRCIAPPPPCSPSPFAGGKILRGNGCRPVAFAACTDV